MCSIVAGFKTDLLEDLIDLNQFRGNFSHSCTLIDTQQNKVGTQTKKFGKFDRDLLYKCNEADYKICHVQAPTSGMIEDYNRIHPVEINGSMLWHNGIITLRGIKFLQEDLNTTETFDTNLLLQAILKHGFDILSEIEGLFSCVLLRANEIFIFRTKHGKLFVDNDLHLSSERFVDSKCITADTVYNLDLKEKTLTVVHKFKTLRFNFVIPGEL